MNLIRLLLSTVKDVVFCFSPNRCLLEGMLKYDFKLNEPRKYLMQISFSPLANGPLFVFLFLIWVDPFRYLWSLHGIFGEESSVRFFLLDGQVSTMLLVASVFFICEWFLKKEYVLIFSIFYFLAKSELHLHLALAALIGVYLARAISLYRFSFDLESKTKKIWSWATWLQLLATVIVACGSLMIVDQTWPRFYFLVAVVVAFQFVNFLFLSVWGHFYFKIKNDPAFIPVYFSTSAWMKGIKISSTLKRQLNDTVSAQLKIHQASLAQLQEMKDQSLGVRLQTIENILNKELAYLQTAASRLTID